MLRCLSRSPDHSSSDGADDVVVERRVRMHFFVWKCLSHSTFQPVSCRCRNRFGRRRPFLLVFGASSLLFMCLVPFAADLGHLVDPENDWMEIILLVPTLLAFPICTL